MGPTAITRQYKPGRSESSGELGYYFPYGEILTRNRIYLKHEPPIPVQVGDIHIRPVRKPSRP